MVCWGTLRFFSLRRTLQEFAGYIFGIRNFAVSEAEACRIGKLIQNCELWDKSIYVISSDCEQPKDSGAQTFFSHWKTQCKTYSKTTIFQTQSISSDWKNQSTTKFCWTFETFSVLSGNETLRLMLDILLENQFKAKYCLGVFWVHGIPGFLLLSHLLYVNRYISKSYTETKDTIEIDLPVK